MFGERELLRRPGELKLEKVAERADTRAKLESDVAVGKAAETVA